MPGRCMTDLGFQCSSCLRQVHLGCLNKHNNSWGVTSSFMCPDCSGTLILNTRQSLDVHQVEVNYQGDTVGDFLSYALSIEEPNEEFNGRGEYVDFDECRSVCGHTNGDYGEDLKNITKDFEKTAELMNDLLPGDLSWDHCSKFNLTTDPGARNQIYNNPGDCDTLSSFSERNYHLNEISAELNYDGLASFETTTCGTFDDIFHHDEMRSTHLETLERRACVARRTADAARKVANQKAVVAAQAAIKARAALQCAAVYAELENKSKRKIKSKKKSTTG
ncbi:hypothetical protein AXG93_3856s1080 [Marchantia polymorpha subsp. ruderalis]|nr:hypothetical protein AXG93_3856s1080 [Marchantia polymorpha subsp. ruderalis]